MMKKIIVIFILCCLIVFSFKILQSSEKDKVIASEQDTATIIEVPNESFSFNKENLSLNCTSSDEQLCVVENTVKCTINPNLEGCHDLNLPKFIFMKDEELDRPTEVSYKITEKKVLLNNNVELYTDSTCNGNWFGLCQGTVIYVLAQEKNGKWFLKDLYALE